MDKSLNLREIKKLIEECARDYEIFGDALVDATFIDIRDHLKSAVQGLLKDIKKIENEVTDEYKNEFHDTITKQIVLSTLNDCKKLIKKWFADVINKGEMNEV
ncbi:MAG TPA: hypothetical protein ENF43_02945 [Thermoplasmatales archaeon]|nr:hypothetical protein [Thermoplasmatales archaeon]